METQYCNNLLKKNPRLSNNHSQDVKMQFKLTKLWQLINKETLFRCIDINCTLYLKTG